MKFEIGKFYRAPKDSEMFEPGAKVICVDVELSGAPYCFYGPIDNHASDAIWVPKDELVDFVEWKEPRTWTVTVDTDGTIASYSRPLYAFEARSNAIKVREVIE